MIFWIDINDIIRPPEQISTTNFEKLKTEKRIKLCEAADQYEDPDHYGEKSIAKWNKHWNAIEFISQEEPHIFTDFHFNKRCKETGLEHQMSRHTVKRILLKFWKGGKSKLALLPDFINSGGKGKTRKILNAKRGRPTIYTENKVNIDDKLANEIKHAYEKFYLNVKDASLETAFFTYLRVKYPTQTKQKDFKNIPTKIQFRYWGEKAFDVEVRLSRKKGSKIFNKDMRTINESSVFHAQGPGSLFQIDSTKPDIELVSSINRDIPIGGPTLYFVSDVFSRMIVGVLITLEEPSYYNNARALYNSMISKSQFCKEEGLDEVEDFKEILDEQWPCHFMPEAVVADRAELLRNQSNNIIRDIGIRIENTPAYRPELKGIVENHFNVLHTKIKGSKNNRGFKSTDHKQRGVRDARKDALLTLKEYYVIIINEVLCYNNSKVLKDYPLEQDMHYDWISRTPIQLWNWGIQNRSGKLRPNNMVNLKERLLPKGNATLSRRGIQFKKLWYNPVDKEVRNEQLLQQERRLSVAVSYDPFNLNKIYLHLNSKMFECFLSKTRSRLYFNANMWEICESNEKIKEQDYKDEEEYISQSINSLELAETIFSKAEKRRNKKTNKSLKPKNIRENKRKEKELERQKKAVRDDQAKEVKIIPIKSENKDSKNKNLEFFRKLMDDE